MSIHIKISDQKIVGIHTLKLLESGILHVHTSAESEPTLENLKESVLVAGKMLDYKKVPILFTRDPLSLPPPEIREYWAKKESLPYSIAEAYVLSSLAHKLIGNFYLKINRPERTTKIFTNEILAIEWLKTFL